MRTKLLKSWTVHLQPMHKQNNRFDVTLTLLTCFSHSDVMSNLILKRGEKYRRTYVP